MMNRTFWAGFGVAVVVILLPALVLIDARSSVDRRPLAGGKEGPQPVPPVAPMANDGGGTGDHFGDLPTPPEPALPPGAVSPPPPKERYPGRPVLGADLDHPEIVFSPERIRESIAHDPRSSPPGRVPPHTGIRTVVYDPSKVYTVRTAVSHVTLIDLPEAAKEVYLGDSKLFLGEVFGSRVKIKPITWDRGITTNMIVYTLHRQFAFRLKVVPEGTEDDLLTFYLPTSDTVVNLTPLQQKMEKDLAVREKVDLREQALLTLRSAGAEDPVGAWSEKEGIRADLLGFSALGKDRFALFEITNKTAHRVTLTGIRLRLFRSSLFWEGRKKWVEGEDWSREFRLIISPHAKARALLPADPSPLSSSRDGYLAELRVDHGTGKSQTLDLEAKGGGKR